MAGRRRDSKHRVLRRGEDVYKRQVVLTFAANATLGGATVLNGTIDLTFTISGASVVKKFAWTKSNKGSNGASGANAIVFSVYAPEGTVVINQSGSLALAAVGYAGASEITTGATYQLSLIHI